MICAKHTSDLKKTSEGEATTWSTPAGDLSTKESCTAQILLPELQSSRGIEWKFHVAPSLGNYDMIIGRDMLTDLGIDIRFSDNVISWDGAEMPLKEFSGGKMLSDAFHVEEPPAVQDIFDRRIAENKYEATDLKRFTSEMKYLDPAEQELLCDLMTKHEAMFDGT
jgi:hypothetical protein